MRPRTYDLPSIFERLNKLYFDGKLEVEVKWSRVSPGKAKRSILLGSYHAKTRTINLSRRLDSPRVPLFFVEHVMFHEMLHAVFPREKHRMHTEKFLRFEKLHPDYERARQWEKEHIKILMDSTKMSAQQSLFALASPRPRA